MSNVSPFVPPAAGQADVAPKLAPLPATAAALVELRQVIAKLQNPHDPTCPTTLRLSVERLAQLDRDIEQALSASSHTLARVSEGMQSLLNLLLLADATPLPSRQLFSLISPLHRQLLQARYQLEGRV
ncbi:DUF1484 family protein [Chromobacterium subtsugae]|uniref:DUF1484 family protein n=1 Tax=Chromobacterium subtsugae TaxID=251747 RepID=UPI00064172A4|nr:DUF1484 family protein [Chromobacterium subtsugae]